MSSYKLLPLENDVCIPMPHFVLEHYDVFTSHGIANILIGVLLFAVFVSAFYFTYTSTVEGEIVQAQIENVIKSFTEDLHNSGVDISGLSSVVNNMGTPDYSSEDSSAQANNSVLVRNAIIAVCSFSVFVIVAVFVLLKFGKTQMHLTSIIVINLILVCAVAGTEFFFLNVITRNYISLDPNYVRTVIVDNAIALQGLYNPALGASSVTGPFGISLTSVPSVATTIPTTSQVTSGPSGPIGPSGPSGPSIPMISGSSGLSGPSGPTGPSGVMNNIVSAVKGKFKK